MLMCKVLSECSCVKCYHVPHSASGTVYTAIDIATGQEIHPSLYLSLPLLATYSSLSLSLSLLKHPSLYLSLPPLETYLSLSLSLSTETSLSLSLSPL